MDGAASIPGDQSENTAIAAIIFRAIVPMRNVTAPILPAPVMGLIARLSTRPAQLG